MAQTKKIYNKFNFVGEIITPRDADKLIKEVTFDSGWGKKEIKIGIKASQSNSQFVNMECMIPPTQTYEMSKPSKEQGSKITYAYKDRNQSAVIDNVADYALLKVDMETDFEKKKERIKAQMRVRNLLQRDTLTDDDKEKLKEYQAEVVAKSDNIHTFVNEIDMIDFIKNNLETFKAHKVKISGNYEKTTSKGKYYTSYKPQMIELVAPETPNALTVAVDFFFTKDAVDKADFKSEGKIRIDGYIKGYDSKAKIDKYYPQQFVVSSEKLDLENNEKHKALFDFIVSTYTVKGKNVFHMPTEFNIYNGVEQVEFTIDMLSQRHKTQIELGLKTLDDYKPRGGFANGNNVSEFKFARMNDKDEAFQNGAEDTNVTISELEDAIATSSEETTTVTVSKPSPSEAETRPFISDGEEEELFGDLFG